MHFATPRQLTVIAVAWALSLVAYDQHANPRPFSTYWAEFKGSSTRPTVVSQGDTPQVTLSMPHLCCSGCLSDIRTALEPFTWLAPPRIAAEPPQPDTAASKALLTQNEITLDIVDLTKVDFVALERALEDTGLVPDKMEVSGMGHFRLEVELPHLCCSVCSLAVDEQLERLLRKETQGRWLDSMTTNHVKKTVLIYARLNAVVDILELKTALAHAGFAAHAIRVMTGPES